MFFKKSKKNIWSFFFDFFSQSNLFLGWPRNSTLIIPKSGMWRPLAVSKVLALGRLFYHLYNKKKLLKNTLKEQQNLEEVLSFKKKCLKTPQWTKKVKISSIFMYFPIKCMKIPNKNH